MTLTRLHQESVAVELLTQTPMETAHLIVMIYVPLIRTKLLLECAAALTQRVMQITTISVTVMTAVLTIRTRIDLEHADVELPILTQTTTE